MLNSKKLIVKCSVSLVGPLGGQSNGECQLPVEYMRIEWLKSISGKELTELLPHFPMLSKLEIIPHLSREMMFSRRYQQPMGMEEDEVTAAEGDDDDGTLLFPAHLFDSLQDAHMFPLLQGLIIGDWPKLLGLPFSNHIVSPDCFPRLQELQIQGCPEFSSAIPISWINSLRRATIKNVKLLQEFVYSKSSGRAELDLVGRGDLHSLDQVLVFDKETCLEKLTLLRCPPLELKHLLKLKSLKTLIVHLSDGLVGPLVGQGDVEWQLPIEHIEIYNINGIIGKDLTELLPHLPELSKLEIKWCKNIKQLVVGVDLHQTTSAAISEIEEDDDGVLLFPARLCRSLRELEFSHCPELVLVDPPTLVPGRGGLQALQTLQRLSIVPSPRFLSRLEIVPSRHIFPSSLHFLELMSVKGMGTLEPLSNLSSLVTLKLWSCGENLTCQGLRSLLTTGAQLKELRVSWSPRFFDGWEDAKGGEKQQTLRVLETDDAAGLLSAPICSFLSSSLTTLKLCGDGSEGMERFSEEQEDALQLLSSLQELEFWQFHNLQQLPAGLRNLTGLKELAIHSATVSSLPNGGLPESLQKLIVIYGCNEKLRQHCRGLEGTIPELRIQ
ncbi:unnamed protein product [Triticum aestivum]|uniref:Uncharacterized protein n=1 Tax=Triticum aestivum TaxID=4565 RepID=A0A7H4LA27_WHEAT|nr:unnamed protein product [Triticum aestivum]